VIIHRSIKKIGSQFFFENNIWLWLILRNEMAKIYIMAKGKWVGDTICSFFVEEETIHYLYFRCVATVYVVWLAMWLRLELDLGITHNFSGGYLKFTCAAAICLRIWQMRNSACFEDKLVRYLGELIHPARVFLNMLDLHNSHENN
jgi:hypothetical protein